MGFICCHLRETYAKTKKQQHDVLCKHDAKARFGTLKIRIRQLLHFRCVQLSDVGELLVFDQSFFGYDTKPVGNVYTFVR